MTTGHETFKHVDLDFTMLPHISSPFTRTDSDGTEEAATSATPRHVTNIYICKWKLVQGVFLTFLGDFTFGFPIWKLWFLPCVSKSRSPQEARYWRSPKTPDQTGDKGLPNIGMFTQSDDRQAAANVNYVAVFPQ